MCNSRLKLWFLLLIILLLYIYIYNKHVNKVIFRPNHFIILKETYTNSDRYKYINEFYEKKVIQDKDIKKNNFMKKYQSKALKEDLDLFIYLLQTRYGNYDKFGGDKEFLKRKREFEKYIDSKKELSLFEFCDKFNEYFSNIDDTHLLINSRPIYHKKNDTNYYISNKMLTKRELDKLTDKDKKYVKYTLDKNGKVRYTLVLTRLKIKDFKLNKLSPTKLKATYEYKEYPNFHYLNIFSSKNLHYSNYGDTINDKNVVFDFRGDLGGWNGQYSSILKNYYTNVQKLLSLDIKGGLSTPFKWEYYNGIQYLKDVKKKNGYKIYFLVDRKTSSAPEFMIKNLKLADAENVIIIGTNTRGSLTSNVLNKFFMLPNTKLYIKFGISNSLAIDKAQEGLGIEPDIWLDPNDEKFVEKVKNFVENN